MSLIVLVSYKTFWNCFAPVWSTFYFKRMKKEDTEDVVYDRHDVHLECIIPLLCEQHHLSAMFERFETLLRQFHTMTLTIITTERESLYLGSGASTLQVARDLLQKLPQGLRKRIRIIHYPIINKNLAEQMNWYLRTQRGMINKYFVFYNADSIPSEQSFRYFFSETRKRLGSVFQQSSLFLQNENILASQGYLYGLANGISQGIWTYAHEIPRLINNMRFPNAQLAHCVTHGLFIRSDVLENIGYFPEDSPGEDLYLGFLLRAYGYVIQPIPYLESSTSPASTISILRQKYVWFWGPLGYIYYWKRFRDRFPEIYKKRRFWIFLQTLQGIQSTVRWVVVSPIMAVLLWSAITQTWWHGVPVLLYCWLPGFVYMFITQRFTLSRCMAIIIFQPFVVLTHSIPAWGTLIAHIYYSRTDWRTFRRPKTEQ